MGRLEHRPARVAWLDPNELSDSELSDGAASVTRLYLSI